MVNLKKNDCFMNVPVRKRELAVVKTVKQKSAAIEQEPIH